MRSIMKPFLLCATASLILLLGAESASAAYVGSWFWQNPIPQGESLYSIDFAGDVGWAVGRGSVLRSINGGAQWSVRYDLSGGSTQRTYWDVDVVDSNTVWIAADDGRVLVSRDGGVTWTDRRPAGITSARQIAFFDQENGWLCDGINKTWRTLDGGLTWVPVSLPASQNSGSFYSYGSRFLIVSGADVCSADRATGSVSKIGSIPGGGIADLAFADANHLVGVTIMGQVTRSVDGGRHWSALKPISRYAIDTNNVFFVSPLVGYATSPQRTWKTADGGATWSSYTPTIRDRTGATVSQTLGAIDVVAGPSRYFLVGAAGRLMYSTDKGASWRHISGDFFDDLVGASFASTSSGLLVAREAAYRTSDGGATWRSQPVPSESSFGGLSLAANGRGWLVGKKDVAGQPTGVVWRTVDGGRTFTRQSIPPCLDLTDVCTNDGVRGWASGWDSALLRTTDSGATWRKASIDWSGAYFEYPDEDRLISWVVVLPNGIGYANGAGHLLGTTDSGTHWRVLSGVPPFNAISAVGTDTVVIGGANGTIRRHQHSSPDWPIIGQLPLNGSKWVDDIKFLTPQVGYAICNRKIYTTQDGGWTWTPSGYGEWGMAIATAGSSDAWVYGQGGMVLYNGGILGDFTPPITRTNAPAGWDDADYATVSLSPSDRTGVDSTWWAIGEPSAVESNRSLGALGSSIRMASSGLAYLPYKNPIRVYREGITSITFFSRDANGNLERPRTVSVRLDRRAPSVTTNAAPLYGGSATIKLTASDAHSGVKYTYFCLDGSSPVRRNGSVAYVRAGLGSHILSYWAVDSIGHVSRKGTKRFAVKPRCTLTAPSAPPLASTYVTFTASGYLSPKHALPAPVIVRCDLYDDATGQWTSGQPTRVYTRNDERGSRYSARVSIPKEGMWRIVATHEDSTHYLSCSPSSLTNCSLPCAPADLIAEMLDVVGL